METRKLKDCIFVKSEKGYTCLVQEDSEIQDDYIWKTLSMNLVNASKNQILAYVENVQCMPENRSCKITLPHMELTATNKELHKFFINRMKYVVSYEELKEYVDDYPHIYFFEKRDNKWKDCTGTMHVINNFPDAMEMAKDFSRNSQESGRDFYISIVMPHSYDDLFKQIVTTKDKSVGTASKKKFAIYFDLGHKWAFMVKITKCQYRGSIDKSYAKLFASEKEAQKWIDKYGFPTRFKGVSAYKIVDITTM